MEVLFILISVFVYSKGSDKLLPRGVSLAQRDLYEPVKDFTCLDGSKRIPFMYVNDDYCDCVDGSDEPGTSACPNGRFHCQNIGYIALDLPASRVNDGVCDCCDASDEYIYGNCTNVCEILGAEAKRAAEKEAEIAAQGNQLRLQMISAGKEIRQHKQERLNALELEKIEAQRLKEEANAMKEAAEAAELAAKEAHRARQEEMKSIVKKLEQEKLETEAKAVFKQLDVNSDNILQVEEFNANDLFDQNKDGYISEEELKYYFNTEVIIDWESFLKGWSKLRPTLRDGTASLDQHHSNDNLPEQTQNDDSSNPSELHKENSLSNEGNNKEWDVNLKGNTEEIIDEYNEDDNVEENHDDKIEDLEDEKPENDEEEEEGEVEGEEERVDRNAMDENNYDEETLKLIEDANAARSRFESAERSFQDVDRELVRLKESLSKDYGPEDEFIALDGQCFSYSDREYTYKLCPFDQVVQMAKSGGSETRLGVWAGWQDESHKVMLYDKGQACWNGPQRSTKVTVICGLENAVIGATEPNKCEYELILQTAAACKVPKVSQTVDVHDEF